MKKIFALTCLLTLMCVSRAAAQTQMVCHVDGSTTDINLTEATSITLSGSNLVVDNYSCPTADIASITYQPNGLQVELNCDNAVDVGDIMAGETPTEKSYHSCPDDKHPHMIDLGLPSGTKWACCNVGASKPEDYGGYYAWGETRTKSTYNWVTYQHFQNNSYVNIGSDIAGSQYDAATANWGSPWRMPSQAQIQELLNNCTSAWTTQNGVNGRKFTGSNGGTIFLPAAGGRVYDDFRGPGRDGTYWSSTLYVYMGDQSNARLLYIDRGDVRWLNTCRLDGRSVRPVR